MLCLVLDCNKEIIQVKEFGKWEVQYLFSSCLNECIWSYHKEAIWKFKQKKWLTRVRWSMETVCTLLVCSQGKALDITSFPAEGTEPDNCFWSRGPAVPLVEGSEAAREHSLCLAMKGADPSFEEAQRQAPSICYFSTYRNHLFHTSGRNLCFDYATCWNYSFLYWVVWQGFGSRGATAAASVRSC